VPELLMELVEIFSEAAAADRLASEVAARAPSGERRRLRETELESRGLLSFSQRQPSLMRELRIISHSGDQLWPPVQRVDPITFQLDGRQHPDDCGPAWHVALAEKQARRVDDTYLAKWYENQTAEQENRLQKEQEELRASMQRRA
jgi:hypothetical protein